MTAPVAFLFLGETLLIPHLFPIAEALASAGVPVDLWVSTSVHEALLGRWAASDQIRIRRAPGFRAVPDAADGRNPPLPLKPLMLARMIPHLLRTPVAVCAEQTSLWLPTLLPLRTKFVKTAHGAGSMMARADRRRRAPRLTLVPAEGEREALARHGVDPATIRVTGYIKAAFRHRTPPHQWFDERRPIILYTPHWQPHRSSWPAWGRRIVAELAAQDRYNVILAPHQRLAEKAPEVREVLRAVASLPHVHCDLDSFAMVDGSYTAAADIYLGDTSSQAIEFMAQPRPCIFLNPTRERWDDDPSYAQWRGGQVIDRIDDLLPAIGRAPAQQAGLASRQAAIARASLGDTSGAAPQRAAELILELIERG
ncbi:hypothetical protein [Sphingomonas crusticola]|uniref:hypothetical protein n=1 Tax=Sphingomonas crusticola TaxID=1697973 RepID=UPI000E23FC51|nr:hypothetical protein [Sphingomonas crusticola]